MQSSKLGVLLPVCGKSPPFVAEGAGVCCWCSWMGICLQLINCSPSIRDFMSWMTKGCETWESKDECLSEKRIYRWPDDIDTQLYPAWANNGHLNCTFYSICHLHMCFCLRCKRPAADRCCNLIKAQFFADILVVIFWIHIIQTFFFPEQKWSKSLKLIQFIILPFPVCFASNVQKCWVNLFKKFILFGLRF